MISAIAIISPSDAAEEYDVYLLAGQSNMDGRGLVSELPAERNGPLDNAIIFYRNEKRSSQGWKTLAPGFSIPPKYKGDFPSPTFGPEIGFAHALHQRTPQRKIALIKGSQGGTSLRADWKPGEKGVPTGQGRQYSDFVETIRVATKQLSERGDRFTIRGLLWHQGESDSKSGTDTYSRRLKELIARLREDLDLPHLPVVVGEVFDNGKRDNVRTATQNIARDSPNVELVTSDGTTTSDPGTHFDTKSQLLLGERYAEAIIALQQERQKPARPIQESHVRRPNDLFIAIDDLNHCSGSLKGNPQAKTDNGDEDRYYLRTDTWDGNGPFRMYKRYLYEGGIRVPLIAYWPGTIPAGSQTDQLTTQYDLMPTLAEAGGLPVSAEMDGISILPTLRHQPDKQVAREFLYWEFYERAKQQAVHLGKWKGYRLNGLNGNIELYDLSSDIAEEYDVAENHPDVVARIDQIMRDEHETHPFQRWQLPGLDP